MDEEVLNIQIRKFLKKVGINSQREIEKAVRQAADTGSLDPGKPLTAKMTLELPGVGVSLVIEDELKVSG